MVPVRKHFYKGPVVQAAAKKSAGSAKVDTQFMAVALATYFTSRNLAGDIAKRLWVQCHRQWDWHENRQHRRERCRLQRGQTKAT